MNRLHLTAAMAALALAIVGLSAQGQDRRPDAAPREPFGPPARVLERLELTQDQKKKIETLVKDFGEKHKRDVDNFREDMGKLRGELAKAGRDDTAVQEKLRKQVEELTISMRKLEDELDGQIAGQLNGGQKKKFEDAKKELTGRGGDRPKGDPGGDRPKAERPKGDRPDVGRGPGGVPPSILLMPGMAERLGLSAEQKEKLAKIRKEYDEKLLDVLTPEQKKQIEETRNRLPGGGRFGPGRRPGTPPERPGRDKDKDSKDKDKKSREF